MLLGSFVDATSQIQEVVVLRPSPRPSPKGRGGIDQFVDFRVESTKYKRQEEKLKTEL
jgi:hypothetical protein